MAERQRVLREAWDALGAGPVQPRAMSGDSYSELEWDEHLTVTVGNADADIVGHDHRVIQAAVDYVAGLGGGTVKLLPGTYVFRNAVDLRSNVRLVGSGKDTVLCKADCVESKLADNSDWFEQEMTLADATGFEIGDGVCFQFSAPDGCKVIDALGAQEIVVRRTIVGRSGKRFKLDQAIRANMFMKYDTTVSTLFSMIKAENASNIVIENLAIDGNRDHNPLVSGNFAACIWLLESNNIIVRDVEAHHYNGDGIVWAVCHDVLVENCHIHDNGGLGLHPGSGAQRAIIRGNTVERCQRGLYFCWGVKFSLAENNTLRDNVEHGISIGHHDDYNIVRNNLVEGNKEIGIYLRREHGEGFTPRGNYIENNRVVDNGHEAAAAIDIEQPVAGNVLARNQIIETRSPAQRIGIRIESGCGENTLIDNAIEGFSQEIVDLR